MVEVVGCRSGCPFPGSHETWGACLGDAGIQIDKHALANSVAADRQKDHTLARFRECVKSGITPESPLKGAVEKAERTLSSA